MSRVLLPSNYPIDYNKAIDAMIETNTGIYTAPAQPPQIEGTPQTGRNSCVNLSNVIHYPQKILRTPIRDILYNWL